MQDLTGKEFGRLTVLRREGTAITPNGTKRPTWECKCERDETTIVQGINLRTGKTKSCGCLLIETTGNRARTHGMRKTSTYDSWRAMKERCDNPNNSHFHRYGGRGITYCERWSLFENFLNDMGERPEGQSLNRINNDEGYYKENCEWASTEVQSRNTVRSVKYTYNGETKNLCDWSDQLGLSRGTLRHRLKTMSFEQVMNYKKHAKSRDE